MINIQQNCPFLIIVENMPKCKFSKKKDYPICRPSKDCEEFICKQQI